MQRDDRTTLADIQEAATLCLEFVSGLDHSTFLADLKTQAAVLHELLIIGEATTRLSESFTEQHQIAPWPKMIGMRNRLIHAYDDDDLDIVWETIQLSLPELLRSIDPLLPPIDK